MKFTEYLLENERKGTAEKAWRDIESDIQKRALSKDKTFRLDGAWKTLLKIQDGFKVYIVDGEWVRNNLSVIFGHGGHGWVHEFIPLNEIWVSNIHPKDCDCGCKGKGSPQTPSQIEAVIIHEIHEAKEMSDGKTPFYKAHHLATKVELKSGLVTAKEIGEEKVGKEVELEIKRK